MFNVIKKFALDPSAGVMFTNGFNKPRAMTTLVDHTARRLRPNNDTLYQGAVLDLRHDPVIIDFLAIDSKYVSLETSGYDHYVGIPLASSKGDFKLIGEDLLREVRRGQRSMLLVDLAVPEAPGHAVTVVSTHLENRAAPTIRRQQMHELSKQIQARLDTRESRPRQAAGPERTIPVCAPLRSNDERFEQLSTGADLGSQSHDRRSSVP